MRSLQPTEARKRFFKLGEMARKEPLLVTASTPFMVLPPDALLKAPLEGRDAMHGVDLVPERPFTPPQPVAGPQGASLSDLVSKGRR